MVEARLLKADGVEAGGWGCRKKAEGGDRRLSLNRGRRGRRQGMLLEEGGEGRGCLVGELLQTARLVAKGGAAWLNDSGKIIKLLERESISWSEEDSGKIIVIPVGHIDPKKLSFAK